MIAAKRSTERLDAPTLYAATLSLLTKNFLPCRNRSASFLSLASVFMLRQLEKERFSILCARITAGSDRAWPYAELTTLSHSITHRCPRGWAFNQFLSMGFLIDQCIV